ncbi:MAG: NAD(P)/FAD-dependent oxidoreductase, partial [Pseudomonadota bacterium]
MASESVERTDTVVVGAGQAGIAASEHLRAQSVEHVVLERARIAERWRSERWDSLVANGPAWHDRFPNLEFDCGAEIFPDKESVADYFAAYARAIDAPVRTGVDVRLVARLPGRPGFRVETSAGVFEARNVIAATGAFQRPLIPAIAGDVATSACEPLQIHSNAYRNPGQLPPGAVLVVGSGSSGVQIADDLLRAGRRVYLSVGPHDRPPRRYRGRDYVWWLGVLGKWNADTPGPGTEHVTIAVSGAHGGATVEFRALAHRGMTLLGMTTGFANGVARFAPDLAANLQRGDANYLSVLDEADAYIARYGLDLPEEPGARLIPADPACVTTPIRELDLAGAGIGTIIWATGY